VFDHQDVMLVDHQDVDQPFHGIHFVLVQAQGVIHPTISIYTCSIDNFTKKIKDSIFTCSNNCNFWFLLTNELLNEKCE
jgi:hypothetical protein